MTVSSTGKVGIGESASTKILGTLTVKESNAAVDGVNGAFIDVINSNTNLAGSLAGIRFSNYDASSGSPYLPGGIFWRSDGQTFGRGDIYFVTGTTGGSANTNTNTRMVIKSNGEVGIGITTPNRQLEVGGASGSVAIYASGFNPYIESNRAGNFAPRLNMGTGSGQTTYEISSDGFVTTTAEYVFGTSQAGLSFRSATDAQKSLGAAAFRWTTVYATNGVINTSDGREKENIADLKYGLNEVMKLKPVSFTWKSGADKSTKLGLIAQDILPVIKEVVVNPKDTEPEFIKGENGQMEMNPNYIDRYGVSYSELIPVLIKAIQEQQEKIQTLEKKIDVLEKK
jgi:trimeric autotransporter adhesin